MPTSRAVAPALPTDVHSGEIDDDVARRHGPVVSVASLTPRSGRGPMRRASSHPRTADLPKPSGTVSVSQHVISANGPTAITSGRMRARRVAVQGSPLRSDRALCARLARVRVRPGRLSCSVSARP